MNKITIILASVVGIFLIAQLLMSYKNGDIETPKYKVVKTYDSFEIRQYDSMILAQTVIQETSIKKSGNTGFRRVAGYIFGGNRNKQQIAMTAPVIMEFGDNTKMSFVMPSQYKMEDLPQPTSSEVKLVKATPKKFAVLRFSGFASDKKINRKKELLREALEKEHIIIKGEFSYLGYNAPWEIFGRRNEVAVEVE
ncbi:MAG: heme-binding protein [Bacteroidetes bacterium]|nr:heme-binding protein [Bacteroidota bacterium]